VPFQLAEVGEPELALVRSTWVALSLAASGAAVAAALPGTTNQALQVWVLALHRE
jgi:hypothetical protein